MNIHELAKKLSPYILKEHQRQDKALEAMRLMFESEMSGKRIKVEWKKPEEK